MISHPFLFDFKWACQCTVDLIHLFLECSKDHSSLQSFNFKLFGDVNQNQWNVNKLSLLHWLTKFLGLTLTISLSHLLTASQFATTLHFPEVSYMRC